MICLGAILPSCKKEDGIGGILSGDKSMKEVRIGIVKDAGAAPIVMAQSQGLFEKHGLTVTLTPLESTEAVRRELARGNLEIGMLHPGDALVPNKGSDFIVPLVLSRNDGAISVSMELWEAMQAELLRDAKGQALLPLRAEALGLATQRASQQGAPMQFKIESAHAASTYALCYWLAAAGITPAMTMDIAASHQFVDGARVLVSPKVPTDPFHGHAGSFVDQPSGQMTLINAGDIVRDLPSSLLAARADWTTANEETLLRAVTAVIEAGEWLDASMDNRRQASDEIAQTLGTNSATLQAILTGSVPLAGNPSVPSDQVSFARNASAAPDRVRALWILSQMARWGQLPGNMSDGEFQQIAEKIFRPELFVEAVKRSGVSMPSLRMRLDEDAILEHLIDGNRFKPGQPKAYLESFEIGLH
ncbi:MAG: nitrate/nitrite transport system substrate-binding protein [Verrucomicrobiales bacterium]|jgi:nitrate/nitrite transport system substrate-binding protein